MSIQRDAKVEQALATAKTLETDAIPTLEEYLKQQIQKEFYDMEANLALLKLYQFYPAESNLDVIQKLLLKALLDLPSNAFLLCSYLIPERHHERKELELIRTLHRYLEECRFKEFWASQELKDVQVSSPIPGLETSARNYGYDILSVSHQRCEEAVASDVLNLAGTTLRTFLKGKGAELKEGVVTFPSCDFNQKRAHEVQSSVQVGHVARIF
eukprot:TRINITY_DN60727_c0_g1_i1.p1 TRINITY_DN60727_c0_g1~~TRINITY_DN60727_c0_g1_i1.p1  ORF type:complete len:213 (+),score=107.19 TRINITY_DN60727_c0_g1_i1:92-730(+)